MRYQYLKTSLVRLSLVIWKVNDGVVILVETTFKYVIISSGRRGEGYRDMASLYFFEFTFFDKTKTT